jgi:DNA-binding CsgD family transcriptional regulator
MDNEQAIIVLSADGAIRHISARAQAYLSTLGDADPTPQVPEIIAGWLERRPGNNLAVASSAGQLEIQFHPCRRQGPDLLLILRMATPPTRPTPLLGVLTQREAEVFAWLLKGKSNSEIGQILGSAPRTIDKHVQRIFRKLGVVNRADAIVRCGGRHPPDGASEWRPTQAEQ